MRPLLVLALFSVVPAVTRAGSVAPAVPVAVQSFDLADVTLGPGPFREARDRDRAYLLSLDPDRLLHTFRLNVGLPSSARPYGGWEAPDVELRGHTLGHYLSACSLMYRSTGDAVFKQRVDTIVAALAECQAASPKAGFHAGYLSAFPESFIDRIEQRKEVWAPWYTLHKIMAGLLDAHQLAGNAQALDVLVKMAGWVQFRVDRLTPGQMQASLQTEFGGMNEVLANLYGVTGDPEHLKLAQAFNQAKVLDPLAHGRDELDGLHANTQIPKIIGAARQFELTGDPRYRDIARNFWTDVALHRSYVIGGDSDREHFFPVDDFAQHLGPETTETCNTYNMLKITRHLFAWQPDAREMDFYERGLYNHILASQDPARGTFVYLMSLAPGHFKTYSTAENSFWCCVGTGMENHAKYGDTIFGHDDRTLFVNLFIAATVNWRDRGVCVQQETTFPDEDTTRLIFTCEKPTALALRIRHPAWAQGEVAVSINGRSQTITGAPGSYFELNHTWTTGDRVEVRFPMALHTEALPGRPDMVALLYGPIVLAGELGIDGMPSPYARDQLDQARIPDPAVPAFVTDGPDWLRHVELVSRAPLLFRTRGLARPQEVELRPFFRVHHERYTVYWRTLAPAAWDREQQAVAAIRHDWATAQAAALDQVAVGDENAEAAHAFQGAKTDSGRVDGLGWREAQRGGFFSYELAVPAGTTGPLTLVTAIDSRGLGRNYDVYAGDRKLAPPSPDGPPPPGDLRLIRHAIPAEVHPAGGRITIRFQSADQWDAATATVRGLALVRTDG